MAVTKKKGRLQTGRFHALILILEMLNALAVVKLGGLVVAGYIGGSVFFVMAIPYFFLQNAAAAASRNLKTQISYQKFRAGNSFWCSTVLYELFVIALVGLFTFFFGEKVAVLLWNTPDMKYLMFIGILILLLFSLCRLLEEYIRGTGYVNILKTAQLIRVLVVAAASVAGLYLFEKQGEVAAAILHNENAASFYSAAGALAGVSAALALSFLVSLVLTFLVSRNYLEKKSLSSSTSLKARLDDVRRLIVGEWFFAATPFVFVLLPFIAVILYLTQGGGILSAEKRLITTGMYIGIAIPVAVIILQIWHILMVPVRKLQSPVYRDFDVKMIRIFLHGTLRGYLAIVLPLSFMLFLAYGHLTDFLCGPVVTGSEAVAFSLCGFMPLGLVMTNMLFEVMRNLRKPKTQLIFLLIGFVAGLGVLILLKQVLHAEAQMFPLSFLVPALVYFVFVFFELKKQLRFGFVYLGLAVEQLLLVVAPGLLVYILDRYGLNGWGAGAALAMVCGIYALVYLIAMMIVPVVSDSDLDSLPGAAGFLTLRHLFFRG